MLLSPLNLFISGHCFRLRACFPCPRSPPLPSFAKFNLHSSSFRSSIRANRAHASSPNSVEEADDELKYLALTAVKSNYNDILILDTPESRILLLDSSYNVHSIVMKGEKWTGSYWDEFASLPPIVPKGPIAIFGLGGGTAAHLILHLWPSLQLEGWEIDEILIDKAREYLWLSDLEKCTQAGGILHVHVGDALSPSVSIPGGFAGIIIDLFSDGKVLPQLQEVATWLELKDKLMPHGRLMINCGAADNRTSDTNGKFDSEILTIDGTWEQNSTIQALCKAIPGQVNWKKLSKSYGENFIALTGPLPNLTEWSAALPDRLSSSVKHWSRCLSL